MAERGERGSAAGSARLRNVPLPLLALWLVVPATALLIAGTPVLVTVAATIGSGAAAIVCGLHPSTRRRAVPSTAWILAGLAIYSLLQSIPVPIGLLAKIAPAGADIWQRSLAPLGKMVTVGAMSLDPGASTLEAAKWAGYAALLYVAVVVSRSHGARSCLYVIAASSVLVALVTVVHELTQAESVYGLYKPVAAYNAGRLGPFLNPNHLAGYLDLGALVSLGLMLSPRRSSPRWVLGTAAIVDIGVAIRTGSRGGVAALLVGLLLLGGLVALGRRGEASEQGRARRFTGIGLVGGTALVGAVLASFGFDRALSAELTDPDTGKLALVLAVRPMLLQHLPFGVGRGAFESVFEAYRPAIGAHKIFTHPENVAAQWLSEWGLVGGAALLVLVWQFRPWRLGLLRSEALMGAFAGVSVLFLQNLVDFSLEVPAVGFAFAVALGALRGDARSPSRSQSNQAKDGRASRWAGVGLGVVAIATSLLGTIRGAPTLVQARGEAQRLLGEKPLKIADAYERVATMMSRHPAEYYFPLAGAVIAERAHDNPMPWIQRALERGPTIGRTHFLLAMLLAGRGAKNQALFELRLANEYEPSLAGPTSAVAFAWTHDPGTLLRAVPDGVAGIPMLEASTSAAMVAGLFDVVLALDEEMLARDPTYRTAHMQVAEIRLRQLVQDTCDDRVTCEEQITQHARALDDPSDSTSDQYLARLAIYESDPANARRILRAACQKPGALSGCLALLAGVEEPDAVPHVLDRFVGVSCATAELCAEANSWVANFQAGRGALAQAYGAAVRAARSAPTDERWLRAADLAEAAGLRAEAVHALQEVALRHGGGDPALKQRIETNRQGALR